MAANDEDIEDNVVYLDFNKSREDKFFSEEDKKNMEDVDRHSARYPWHDDDGEEYW